MKTNYPWFHNLQQQKAYFLLTANLLQESFLLLLFHIRRLFDTVYTAMASFLDVFSQKTMKYSGEMKVYTG